MPLECPKFTRAYNSAFSEYNACLSCGSRHGDECWLSRPSRKLADILTTDERISILEDRLGWEEGIIKPIIPRPVVNVSYFMDGKSTPAFKELQERIDKVNGRFSQYFEGKRKKKVEDIPF